MTIHTHTYTHTHTHTHEGVSKSFWTGRLERELQMVQLSATRCSCIAILWVSLVSFAAITVCVASQREFIVVYIVIDSVRKLLDTLSYNSLRFTTLCFRRFGHGVHLRKYKEKNFWTVKWDNCCVSAIYEKTNFSLCLTKHHAMKTYWGWGMAPCILDLGNSRTLVVSFTSLPLYSRGKSHRWGGPQNLSVRGGEEKNSQPQPGIEHPPNPYRPAHSQSLWQGKYIAESKKKKKGKYLSAWDIRTPVPSGLCYYLMVCR
jgi:hypothetical protein